MGEHWAGLRAGAKSAHEFDTKRSHEPNRLGSWRDMICRHQMLINAEPIDGHEFGGRIKFKEWGDVQISEAQFSPVRYKRGSNEIRQSDREDFLYVLYDKGCGSVETDSTHVNAKPGDLVIYDLSQPYSLNFPSSGRTIAARIPRPLFTKRIPQADRQFILHIGGDQPMAKLSASLLKNVAGLSGTPSAAHSREAAHSLVDMLCVAVRDVIGDEALPTPGQAATLRRIKAGLLTQLGNEHLNVEAIAKQHGISPRTLNRMFAAEGTTVMRWLWKQRLSASYQALSRGEVRQVTEAAFEFGFKDCSHFARAFQKEFKIQPRRLLNHS